MDSGDQRILAAATGPPVELGHDVIDRDVQARVMAYHTACLVARKRVHSTRVVSGW